MIVKKVIPKGFGCNTYILTRDKKNAVVIDCADEGVFDECRKLNLLPVALLLTHGHFDHVGGCGKFYAENVPIYCGEGEEQYTFSRENRLIFGGVYIPEFKICRTLKDGEQITLGGIDFEVIQTKGHTAGGVCYLAEDCLFWGDTLFREGMGRYDLPGGNPNELKNSLKKLISINKNLKVYCGHGEDTTLDYERKNNIYVNY